MLLSLKNIVVVLLYLNNIIYLHEVGLGEERYTPPNTVPVSPQCSQEIIPLPLPPLVLQGTAISSESLSQLPPGNVAALRGSLPLKVCSEQLDRPSPAGYPLQGTELSVQSIPEASLESTFSSFTFTCRRVKLTTDASLTGWGAVMSGRSAQGLWEVPHLMWHINACRFWQFFKH